MEFATNLILGGTSGCIAKSVCAPLERIKIVLQTSTARPAGSVSSGGLGAMVRTGQLILVNQGVKGLWRGNLTNCLRFYCTSAHTNVLINTCLLDLFRYFPTQAMNFAFKERYQQLLVPDREKVGFGLWFAGFLAAGGAAGATSLTVAYPLEFAYTRLAADTSGQFKGLGDVIKTTYRADGFQGLYRGFAPSVAGIIIYRAGYFGFYDVGKQVALSFSLGACLLLRPSVVCPP